MKKTLLTLLLISACLVAQAQQLLLGGELSNSAATSVADIDSVMPRMKALGLNTVLVPAYWEFLEPQEGQYDFTLVDRVMEQARSQQLKVVFLWFGAWKNSMSCYAPLWFKQDVRRFPRARTATGKPLEIASAFSPEVLEADSRAFAALMQRISERGSDVVTMVQVENEIGMLESARDHSPLAEAAYRQGVPHALANWLKSHRQELHPWLKARLKTLRGGTSWTEAFGDDVYTDEIFMAYYYACYVEQLCQAVSHYSDLPLYVNAAMNSRGRQPGQYPSAGPLAHLIDLWHAGAPSLLLLAPDIYDSGFKDWCAQYALSNNRLFIPESRCCENSGVRALYAFGEHNALGFSPFAIDEATPQEAESITRAYSLLKQTERLEIVNQKSANRKSINSKSSWGLLFDQQDCERVITDGDLAIVARHYFTLPWDPRAATLNPWPEGGALLLKLGSDDYLLAGSGVVVEFKTLSERTQEQHVTLGEDGFAALGTKPSSPSRQSFSGSRCGLGSVDEVCINPDGSLKYLRRNNGDQDHQGRHARIAVGEWKILHIRLYRYY